MQANDVDAAAAATPGVIGSVGKAEGNNTSATNPFPKDRPLKKARIESLDLGPDGDSAAVGDSCKYSSVLDPAMKDIWVHKIFPFLGPGHFLYMALVCKQFKENYLGFFSTLKDPPMVKESISDYFNSDPDSWPAVATNTFYSAAFSSMPCAKFWDKITKGGSKGLRLGDNFVCLTVAKHGNLQVFKWAHGNGFPLTEPTCSEAAANGHLQVLKYALKKGCAWTQMMWRRAAMNGQLGILKFAQEKGLPWKCTSICCLAAKSGHLDVLKWAQENGCPWNEWTCAQAAWHGQLEVLKWARDHECPWGKYTCVWAAGEGHLDVLKWARENGCQWDGDLVRQRADQNNQQDILEWLNQLSNEDNA